MFTKQQIKDKFHKDRRDALAQGRKPPEAGLSLAMIIAATAHYDKATRSGEDYIAHPLHVATDNIQSKTKRIIAIMHDVLEDSDWTEEDLRELGFSERVIRGIVGVTKQRHALVGIVGLGHQPVEHTGATDELHAHHALGTVGSQSLNASTDSDSPASSWRSISS